MPQYTETARVMNIAAHLTLDAPTTFNTRFVIDKRDEAGELVATIDNRNGSAIMSFLTLDETESARPSRLMPGKTVGEVMVAALDALKDRYEREEAAARLAAEQAAE